MPHPMQNKVLTSLITGTTSATTARTANLDCQYVDFATIIIQCSAEANTDSTNVVMGLLTSDDTVVSNFATVVANVTLDNTSATSYMYHVGLAGKKRYLRLTLTPDTTTNGAVIVSASALTAKDSEGAVASNVTVVE